MARANIIQTNFTSGEISPLMRGRVDTVRYANGAERVENFIIKPQGGAWRRSGTRFIGSVKFPDKLTVIAKFQFSVVQAYLLEVGETYIRFYRDDALIVDGGGDPVEVVTPYGEEELQDLYFAQSADVLYICHPAHPIQKLERFSHTDWRMEEFITDDGPYLSSPTPGFVKVSGVTDMTRLSVDLPTTFVIGDVTKFVEYREANTYRLAKITGFVDDKNVDVDVIDEIIVGLDTGTKLTVALAPIPLVRPTFGGGSGGLVLSATSQVAIFSQGRLQFQRVVPPSSKLTQSAGTLTSNYSGVFTSQDVGKYVRDSAGTWWKITAYSGTDTVSVSAVTLKSTGAAVITLSNRQVNATVQSSEEVFDVLDVGRKIRLEFSGQQTWGTITTFNNTKEVIVNFHNDLPLDPNDPTRLPQDGITYFWKLGAWSERTGYPGTMTIHEQRTVFAGSPTEPQTVWMSRSGDYQNFAPTELDSTVLEDSAITYTLAASEANAIVWLDSGPVLLIGTIGQPYQVKASSSTMEPLSPSNISVVPCQSGHGSSPTARPQRVGSAVLFVQRGGRKVRELVYDYAVDGYVAKNLNIIAEHMLRRGGNQNQCIQTAYQQEPNNVLWCVLKNGELVGMTYEKDQEVVAWHYHPIGGNSAEAESVAVVPSITGTEDEVYVLVNRLINGSQVRYIEKIESEFEPTGPDDKDEMFFLDCGLSYHGVAATTISGLDHLEGETVGVLADGYQVPDKVVNGGMITLPAAASVVHVGYRFQSLLKALPLEGGSQAGTSQGKIKRVSKVDVRIHNTIGFKHGSSEDKLTPESFRHTDDPMDESPALATEDRRVSLDQGYTNNGGYFIVQDSPYPLVVLALMPQLDTYE